MAFHIVRNDIVNMKVDAIVNSANPKPTYAYGTDLAIYKAAGVEELLEERKKIGDIAPGEVGVTSGCRLNVKYIIHTVGPSWNDGHHGEFDILTRCYENVLKTAHRLKCNSIAFPLIATGVYGFPKDKALEIAMISIQKYLLRHPQMDIYLVVFDEKAFVLSGHVFDEIQAYVDSHYVEEVHYSEYDRLPSIENSGELSDDELLRYKVLGELEDKVADLVKREKLDHLSKQSEKHNSTWDLSIADAEWESILSSAELTFQEKLFSYIDKSGLKPSEIYRPIEMSRQNYSKMQSNKYYQPKKNTALLLCIVLHLNIIETEDLLARAGLAFNPSSKQDLIIKACILRKQYDLFIIDCMLQKNNLDTLIDYDGKEMSPLS